MQVMTCKLRDFRCYERAEIALGERLTVVSGPNGAGKTNLVEAMYFGCTGRSCRTTNEREMLRFSATSTRVVIDALGDDGPHELSVGFSPGEPKRMEIDRAPVDRLLDSPVRPLVSVFVPDRLELVKGSPAIRRAHMDQLVGALWPSRAATRRAYAQSLAHRNALISRVRTGGAPRQSLRPWDLQLARHGAQLMADRAQAIERIAGPFASEGAALGMGADAVVLYRPRSQAAGPEQLAAELAERIERDLERGFTSHGPHRDELLLLRAGRELRAYGSQGQQRLALLSLLLAERQAIAEARDALPLLLLDDVMSELDHGRRRALVDQLRSSGGQSVITTTDLEHVPGASAVDVARLAVSEGRVLRELAAA